MQENLNFFNSMEIQKNNLISDNRCYLISKFFLIFVFCQNSLLFGDDIEILGRDANNAFSFSSPVQHVNDQYIYYTLVRPGNNIRDWRGNLKRYKLGSDSQIYDVNSVLSLNPMTGFFTSASQSYWSSTVDGDQVMKGGVASHQIQGYTLYTNILGDTNVKLNTPVHPNNVQITASTLGVHSNNRDGVLKWASGIDVDDEDADGNIGDDRTSMGDPLHTTPKIVNYFSSTSWPGMVDQTLYFTTNDGILHAVNTDNGKTIFSFIPKELLVNLKYYKPTLNLLPEGWKPISNQDCTAVYEGIQSNISACHYPEYCSYQYTFGDLNYGDSCRLSIPLFDNQCRFNNDTSTCEPNAFCYYDTSSSQSYDWQCRLKNIRPGIQMQVQPYVKVYGLDGPMSVWHNDINNDGNVLMSYGGVSHPGGHVFLYLTMRRGGNNIYALDITDRNAPVLKWVIRGDVNKSRTHDHNIQNYGFPELGQTWSEATPVTVNWKGNKRKVLIFGAGYDANTDNQIKIEDNNIGRGVYVVDANTGQKLWTAGIKSSNLVLSDMKYSIVSAIAPVDFNKDGLVDWFYVADVGGQIWRFDINNNNNGAIDFAEGGRVAKLSGSTSVDARRFYENIDVALGEKNKYYYIAIGSGFRAQPYNTLTQDRFYIIKDPHTMKAPIHYLYDNNSLITDASLYDATSNLIQTGSIVEKKTATVNFDTKNGWFIDLKSQGEKTMSMPLISHGLVMFSTFAPNIYTNKKGINYFYALNLYNASAVIDFNKDSVVSTVDRKKQLKYNYLSPTPIITEKQGNISVCVGLECEQDIAPLSHQGVLKTYYWREK